MIQLRHFVAQHPHGGALRRRRDRRMGAVHPSRPVMIAYAHLLRLHVVDKLHAGGLEALQALRPHWPIAHDRARDAKPPTIKHEVGRVRARIEPKTKGAAPEIAVRAVNANAKHVDEKLGSRINMSLGVQVRQTFLLDQSAIASTMKESLSENVELITSISDDYFDELEYVLADNWVNVGDWREAVDDVMDLGDVTESRAELIARDQTMKMNSRFNEARQTSLGVKQYEWVTVGDDRVRPAHEELEGSTQDWDDPPTDSDGNTGHAGDCGIDDRCAADPILDLDADEDADAQADVDVDEETDEG